MILLAGGFATGGSMPEPSMMDMVMVGTLSGLSVAILLAFIWGGICYWASEITEHWRWVRLSRRVRLPIGPQIRSSYRYRGNTDAVGIEGAEGEGDQGCGQHR